MLRQCVLCMCSVTVWPSGQSKDYRFKSYQIPLEKKEIILHLSPNPGLSKIVNLGTWLRLGKDKTTGMCLILLRYRWDVGKTHTSHRGLFIGLGRGGYIPLGSSLCALYFVRVWVSLDAHITQLDMRHGRKSVSAPDGELGGAWNNAACKLPTCYIYMR